MKFQKIYMKAWLDCHARVKREDSDQWYLDLANDLLPLISQSCIYRDATERSQQHVALILSLYLEDCVADEGTGGSLPTGITIAMGVTYLFIR